MQRIYGTAFFKDSEDLKQHLHRMEEAKKRDHRKSAAISACSRSTRGRRARRSGWARAPAAVTNWRPTCESVLYPAGYAEVKTPLIFEQGALGNVGPLATLPPNMFLVESPKTPRWASRP